MVDGVLTMDQALQHTGDLVAQRAGVVQPAAAVEAVPVVEPFAVRLERVVAEAEAVAAHAQERAMLRAEQGRVLSPDTRSRLEALASSLGTLVAAAPAKPISPAKVQYMNQMIRTLQEQVQ
jgi:hypothetical protein